MTTAAPTEARPFELFARGTPEAPGAALAAVRATLGAAEGPPLLRWHVDPGNLGLLSRTVRELAELPASAAPSLTVVLAAEDLADDRTVVAREGELAPTLRRLRDEAERREGGPALRLELTTGRPYFLPPPALDISTNDLCGLACTMCGNRATTRDPHTITVEQVRALVEQAAAWGIRRVALTGAGEPFRDPAMLDHIRHANALGHLVTITTNGFPISEKIATELAERVLSVSVSIHGATDATHDEITGVAKAGENAWRAIRRMARARAARPGSKLRVNVSTVIQRANVHEIAALVRRAREEGCDGINIQPVNLQHGSFRDGAIVRRDDLLRMAHLWPGADRAVALASLFDELAALRAEHGAFVHATPERIDLLRRYFVDSSREALQVACRVGEAFLAVDHRGEIKPCYRLPWSHGDARLTSVQALWNSQAYARTRALIDACPLTCLNNCFFREKRAS
ncbi:MAG TPA: radical SAM protein [Polyangiaceae bacterium]|jgi:MoaA/NifB/PqqE/SkfB family radical SAM enzyme|nr:radical SAM protein [Polyangiaceae bacterium]